MSGGIPMERMTPEEIARLKLRCTNRDGSAEVLTSKAWAHITLQDAEIEKLRAALEPLACTCDRPNGAACSRSEADCPFWNARTVLEGK